MSANARFYPLHPMNTHPDDELDMPSDVRRQWRPNIFRRVASPVILAVFMVSLLWMGLSYDYSFDASASGKGGAFAEGLSQSDGAIDISGKKPDYGQYVQLRTITEEDIDIEVPQKRLIIVGDIHGMDSSFEKLLSKVEYQPKYDYLAHLGDIVAKGPDSMRVLSRMASQNVTGVRGNHDQKVIEWRGFIEWVKSQKGGHEWFDDLVSMELSPKEFKKLPKHKKKFPLPDGWKWGSEHWNIARKMSVLEYNYLRNLPLAIHIPSFHAFLVHGGMLPSDPTRDMHNRHQPLSHLPALLRASKDIEVLRTAQELSLLSEIPQNRDPWTLLNIRDITAKGKVSRVGGDGTPWAEIWNEIQSLCKGFDISSNAEEDLKKKRLPCYATSVIYGHSASRGLDVQRWSTGIDTGCVYGRRLSALVFGDTRTKGVDEAGGEEELEEMRFGDSSKTRLVSVNCPKP